MHSQGQWGWVTHNHYYCTAQGLTDAWKAVLADRPGVCLTHEILSHVYLHDAVSTSFLAKKPPFGLERGPVRMRADSEKVANYMRVSALGSTSSEMTASWQALQLEALSSPSSQDSLC